MKLIENIFNFIRLLILNNGVKVEINYILIKIFKKDSKGAFWLLE